MDKGQYYWYNVHLVLKGLFFDMSFIIVKTQVYKKTDVTIDFVYTFKE